MNYYNEHDAFAAQWLRELIIDGLIPDGTVDSRSIVDVEAKDLSEYTQCHFFAGIGGWSRALELAGWEPDRPVWTGSPPCQPFSSAGTGGSTERQQIWQQRSTDLGLSYYRLQVSMPRTAEKGYSLWPTPATRDYKDSGDLDKSRWRKDGKERNDTAPRVAFGAHQLSTAATKSTEQPHYNPKFSLWLMGYPKVWAEWAYSKARVTQSSRKQRQK